jgi:RNA polymerase sigma-70 factor (ECF subfamily)
MAEPTDMAIAENDPADERREIAALLPQLRAFARFLTGNPTEADDLVQDAVLRGLGSLNQYQPTVGLRAWLFTILRNRFYEQARRRRIERRILERYSRDAPLDAGTEGPRQEHEAALRELSSVIWTLSPRLREALILVAAQGLPHEEAAQICNVSVGAMKARVSRARAEIARAMQSKIES